ncbi:methylated-DNA--[protein]-cysteine S-methyltransferase [Bordetella avium]|uniref:methylated-DNA--[protein]-cysteine S-methyltransferase n=1 Tax=Bordetella avium TaxID=521 RepID=UPI000E0BAE44|nr:methylated-DNA--[protein]-cysteine S-methyltransferase [Bordetella avium]AZY49522.1 cysteine methyltransferase [Bordetella avium]AZY52918.1 cysteine methyltransferase [Bordetella avium]RIQ11702.1 methylated-DNA--[protein]-cysteine S-methyltransferase [Bordetella avium]RIQ16122.1 methylated-DNA--[protein]-cysteine S-methyltransferase [Bordetella avium]RIQ30277.1 methylated-DNA--[protein]-cysteine S-methyltransferase [Bordetella avium]
MSTCSPPFFQLKLRAPGQPVAGPIRYVCGPIRLGRVLIGLSLEGVCCIFIGDSDAALRLQLESVFSTVPLVPVEHAPELALITDFLDLGRAAGHIELDVGGTSFQQSVWQALCDIPAGQTRSYTEVAQGLKRPEAVRAVAGACAANVLAVLIPCHRVLRQDASLTGYRWGIERKRLLLEQERAR